MESTSTVRAASLANLHDGEGKPVAGQQAGETGIAARAFKHGAHSPTAIAPRVTELEEYIEAILPVKSPAFAIAVRDLAVAQAQVEAFEAIIEEAGGAAIYSQKRRGSYENYHRAVTRRAKALKALGLTPQAATDLGLKLTQAGARFDVYTRQNYGGSEQ